MSKDIIRLPLTEKTNGEEEAQTILIEIERVAARGPGPAAIPERERKSIIEALNDIKPLTLLIAKQFKDLPTKEKEVKFGLKFTAQGNVMVATIGGEFNFEVTLRW